MRTNTVIRFDFPFLKSVCCRALSFAIAIYRYGLFVQTEVLYYFKSIRKVMLCNNAAVGANFINFLLKCRLRSVSQTLTRVVEFVKLLFGNISVLCLLHREV